jgi:hypothetical protein
MAKKVVIGKPEQRRLPRKPVHRLEYVAKWFKRNRSEGCGMSSLSSG